MKIMSHLTGKVLWEDASINTLSRADLSGANLSGADLSRANLSGANLYAADLSWADLSRVNLSGANLYRANLSGANLSGADLFRANLSMADLSMADLSRANLIVGGMRSDGYQFFLIKEKTGELKVSAGCRYLSVKGALRHWKKTRAGTRLGAESIELVHSMVRLAKLAGWGVTP